MKKLILILTLFWLSACTDPIIEDGTAMPTAPFATATAPSPAPTLVGPATATATSSTPTLVSPATATTVPPTPTMVDTATATALPSTPTATPRPTITATNEPDGSAERIQFEPGATSATLHEHLDGGESKKYLAWAAAGQHMHVEIVSPNNVANFSLVGMDDGQPLKRLENEDRFWDGTLSQSQDYRIRVHSLVEADFTLVLTIDPLGEGVLQPVWPVVDGMSGFLLGGSHNGQWLDAHAIMPSMQDGDRPYLLYDGSAFLGTITGSPPATSSQGPCGGTPAVTFSPETDLSGKVALVAGWEAAPRQLEPLPLDTPVYQEAIAELLREQGITDPEVQLTSVDKIDLEGDGVDEVLITATRLTGLGNGLPTAAAGDYSLVVLRKVLNEVVMTIPLEMRLFPEAVELADPVQYNVLAVLDLNGNGNQEIVLEGWYYEGRFVTVYEIVGDGVQAVFTAGCRL